MRCRALVVRERAAEEAPGTRPPHGAGPSAGSADVVLGVEELDRPAPEAGELLIRVSYSSLNYKDALAAAGNRGVTKRFPHVPGIDAAGVVEESRAVGFEPGEDVVVTGHELGVSRPGGLAEFVVIPAEWALKLPAALDAKAAMQYGTAGLTAAFAVLRLRRAGLIPGGGPLLVTGASGGVGGFAVAILAKLGYEVHAATGKESARGYLERLGAALVVDRDELTRPSSKPLLHARFQGGVDTIGGEGLATLLKSTSHSGAVVACGNAASPDLGVTVYPFILRGITLFGVDSSTARNEEREEAWAHLALDWNVLDRGVAFIECGLSEVGSWAAKILSGGVTGRIVVDPRR